MKNHNEQKDDPLQNFLEWQKHRYDPGYFVGGRIHPMIKAKRPNKYGYILVINGIVVILIATLIFLRQQEEFVGLLMALGVGVLLIVVGFSLLRKRQTQPTNVPSRYKKVKVIRQKRLPD